MSDQLYTKTVSLRGVEFELHVTEHPDGVITANAYVATIPTEGKVHRVLRAVNLER